MRQYFRQGRLYEELRTLMSPYIVAHVIYDPREVLAALSMT
jgi:hypothetical protein